MGYQKKKLVSCPTFAEAGSASFELENDSQRDTKRSFHLDPVLVDIVEQQ